MTRRNFFIVYWMLSMLAVSATADAATITVTNGNDSGAGSLRQMIADAQAGDTILFQTGVTTVTLTTDQLLIDKNLTIDGGTGVTVQRSSAAGTPEFRIFYINSGVTAEIRYATITNGKAPDGADGMNGVNGSDGFYGGHGGNGAPGGSGASGGGIYINGSLTLQNCTVTENTSGSGGNGGHGGYGGQGEGDEDCSFSFFSGWTCVYIKGNGGNGGNGGAGGSGGFGGGIYIGGGSLNLKDSTISQNKSGMGGEGGEGNCGGSGSYGGYPGSGGGPGGGGLGGSGGGIYGSSLSSENSTVNGNASGLGGEGAYPTVCSINQFICPGNGGSGGHGGGIFAAGSATLKNSTISGNIASDGQNGRNAGDVQCGGGDGGDGGHGGGIYVDGSLSLSYCTVTQNISGRGGFGGTATSGYTNGSNGNDGDGGGIYRASRFSNIFLKNTILADNSVGIIGNGPDCHATSEGWPVYAFNLNNSLIEDKSDCYFSGSGNKLDIAPLLEELADNGGLSQIHALKPGSPAIDSGLCDISLTTDQRGTSRPQGTACDIGAYERDQTPPEAATNLGLSSEDDTGSSNSDILTNKTFGLTITGTGENGAKVQLYSDGAPIGEPVAVSAGNFSMDISLAGRSQSYSITAKQTDISGNISAVSSPLTITVDTTVSAPTIDLSADDDTGIRNSDNITQKTASLTITGSGEDGATVQLYDDDILIDGATGIVSVGRYSIDIALSQGDHAVIAKQTDAAGNISEISQYLNITVDTTPPNAPRVSGSTPTNAPRPAWIWTSTGGGRMYYRYKLSDADLTVGAIEIADTQYKPSANLSDGSHILYVQEQDDAGNWSASGSFTIVIDTNLGDPPTALDLASEDDTGISDGDNITQKTSGLTITGSGENGATVQLYDNGSENSRPIVVSGNRFSVEIFLTEGLHSITARQTDTAGNASAVSSPLTIKVDTTISTPTADLSADDDSGIRSSDNITNKTAGLTIKGSGEDGAAVQLYDGDIFINGATASVSAGRYSIDISLSQGDHALKIRQTDAAGNISEFSQYLDIKVDTTPPNAPKVETSGTTPTSDDRPAWKWFSGGGEGTGKYRWKLNNADLNTGATETVNTAYPSQTALSEGKHTLYVQECDEAGNWSASGSFTIEVKKAAPGVPVVSGITPTDDTTPLWTWESGGAGGIGLFRYKMDDDDLEVGATETSKTSFSPSAVQSQGKHTLYVQEKNDVNIWSASGSSAVEIDSGKPCSEPASPPSVNAETNPFEITYSAEDIYEGGICGKASSGSRLKKVELYVKAAGSDKYVLADTDTGNGIDGKFTYSAKDEGMYYFYTLATDNADNPEDIPEKGYDTQTAYTSQFSGYAILAVDSIKGNEGIEAHTLAANTVYTHLINRGFALVKTDDRWDDPLDHIKYFNPYGPLQPGEDDFVAQGLSYTGALRDALTEWTPAKMKTIPGPLFVILIDHGSPETFYLTGEQPLTAQVLKGWLDTLQKNAEGIMWKNPKTGKTGPPPIVVILGACYSGSFIDDISAPGRIVMTASAPDEPSYRGPNNPYSNVRDGEFFTSALFNGLAAGLSLKAGFEKAVVQTETHTDSGSGNSSPDYPGDTAKQHPLLDDNGDKKGSNLLSAGSDGVAAEDILLGTGAVETGTSTVTDAGSVPETPPALDISVSLATLWAKVSESTPGKSEVWVEIRKPGMILESEDSNQQTVDLESVALAWNAEESRYEANYENFTEPGKYSLFFYAKGENSIISPFIRKFLYKAKSGIAGDVNGSGADPDLADAVLALKICAGDLKETDISAAADTNNDKKIGIAEAVYILRKLAGL
jgi:hypothetical protein